MPKALPVLSPSEAGAADTRDPIAVALEQHLHDVRQWTEWVTNGDPRGVGTMDYGMYRTFEAWVQKREALDVIDSILQSRMAIGFPYSQKAVILAQILPPERLPPYVKLLEPLLPPPPAKEGEEPPKAPTSPMHFNPIIAHLAQSLHATAVAEAAKVEAAKKAEEDKKKQEDEINKWELWCNLYGRTCRSDWYGPPGNPQWTYWGWNEIGREEWWKGRND
ncbi:uncharacterized protein I303_101479 [Kwoniella dejecticola CBS 10117]|uniref:Uncharacterized protein n=1 Tax=Kwoniella dejecticola CBS 10117 TaxID=1296121 RepID=A0A1A6ADQ6_9TREE|nr:uncharacterized protein I303_02388 [Kwoniella dejecticola CBS 10117]OBR88168.1 hypothetical protein I303_02388 [Kwoniella dejecticola CBS 10117]